VTKNAVLGVTKNAVLGVTKNAVLGVTKNAGLGVTKNAGLGVANAARYGRGAKSESCSEAFSPSAATRVPSKRIDAPSMRARSKQLRAAR